MDKEVVTDKLLSEFIQEEIAQVLAENRDAIVKRAHKKLRDRFAGAAENPPTEKVAE